MRAALTLALLALVPGVGRAAEISTYSTRLAVDPDGAGHAASTLVIAGGPSETVEIPLVHGSWANFRVTEASEGLRLEPPRAKASTVQITLPATTGAESRLSYAFDVPGVFDPPPDAAAANKPTAPLESRTLRYAFVNTQALLIKDFGILVTLPQDHRFQAIREQLPRQKKTEVEPRVRLGGADGRQSALLRLANLKQGDATSMQLEVVPNRRSLLWLLAGVALSGLYLAHFRDLVFRKPLPTET